MNLGDTPPNGPNGARWQRRESDRRFAEHDRRISKLEDADIGVLSERVRNLDEDLKDVKVAIAALRLAHYQLMGGILVAIVSFALIVGFAL